MRTGETISLSAYGRSVRARLRVPLSLALVMKGHAKDSGTTWITLLVSLECLPRFRDACEQSEDNAAVLPAQHVLSRTPPAVAG
jgi:hypothetical protein